MNSSHKSRTYAFAPLLSGLLLLLLFVSLSLVIFVSWIFSQESIQELCLVTLDETFAMVVHRIDTTLGQAVIQNDRSFHYLNNRVLNPNDSQEMGRFLTGSMDLLRPITLLGYGQSNGDYIVAERQTNGVYEIRQYGLDANGKRILNFWCWTNNWQTMELKVAKSIASDQYDPRLRPYFKLAVQAQTNTWTPIYEFWKSTPSHPLHGVTYATPVYGPSNQLEGVLHADFTLDSLDQFLAKVDKEVAGYPLVLEITERSNNIVDPEPVAHPKSSVLMETNCDDDEGTLSLMKIMVPSLFVEEEILDASLMTIRLHAGNDPLSAAIWRSFSSSEQESLLKAPDEKQSIILSKLLNRVLRGAYLNETNRFASMKLPVSDNNGQPSIKSEAERLALNRLLLEAAFPRELEKSSARNFSALKHNFLSGKIIRYHNSHGTYYAGCRWLNASNSPPNLPEWLICLVIPGAGQKDDPYHVVQTMRNAQNNMKWAIGISLGCLVLAGIMAVLLARRIAKPLGMLSREAESIGRLELESTLVNWSSIKEVEHLTTSIAEMKTNLRSFRKFVPSDVVKDLVTSGKEAQLGGQRATLTLFFSDVADFTTLAETISPEELVQHVSDYFGEMSEVILDGGGTVDKFLGDGIMAFWGAPRPNENHAADACSTALMCQEALRNMRAEWSKKGKPLLYTRIGLHTGPVIVGNIGSTNRLNYTAIGDSVNLTSRLEGLNKFYGTEILISATCAAAAGDKIITRPVDHVMVKGRKEGLIIHELLGMSKTPGQSMRETARITAEAFEAFMHQDFKAAREKYKLLFAMNPRDRVAAIMERRSADMETKPPEEGMQTAFRMTEK